MAITHPTTTTPPIRTARQQEAHRAALITLGIIILIMLAKGIAGVMLRSIALTSEALHTLLDVMTAGLALVTIRAAQAPPDEEHPYGHGKVENLMALVQSLAIMFPAVIIGWYSIDHLVRGDFHFVVEQTGIGIAVMAFTMVANVGLMVYLTRVAKRTGSPSIAANATHERVDFVSSVIVLLGLILIWYTRQPIWDAVLGVITAIYILREGWALMYESGQVLLDRAAPQNFQDRMHAVLHRHGNIVHAYSNVRSRLHGQEVHADLDIQICRKAPLSEVALLTAHLEEELEAAIPQIQVHLRPLPCPALCAVCPVDPLRLHELVDVHTPVPEMLRGVEKEMEAGVPP